VRFRVIARRQATKGWLSLGAFELPWPDSDSSASHQDRPDGAARRGMTWGPLRRGMTPRSCLSAQNVDHAPHIPRLAQPHENQIDVDDESDRAFDQVREQRDLGIELRDCGAALVAVE